MKGPASDHVGDILSKLIDELEVDPTELGKRALKVWRVRSPALVLQSKKRGENPAATAAGFMQMLLGSLGSDADFDWSDCERRSLAYGRRRAGQAVPLESLIDELAVYRRAAIELISTALEESSGRDEIVALAQSRLEDVTDHINRSIATGYLDGVKAGHPQTSSLAATVSAVGGRSSDLARTARNGLGKTLALLRRRARAPQLRAKTGRLGDATRGLGGPAHVKDAKRTR